MYNKLLNNLKLLKSIYCEKYNNKKSSDLHSNYRVKDYVHFRNLQLNIDLLVLDKLALLVRTLCKNMILKIASDLLLIVTAKAFIKALDSELRQELGITFGQWKVMVMLVNQNGMTQKEIADKLGLEGPTLIPIIDKMECEDLVGTK